MDYWKDFGVVLDRASSYFDLGQIALAVIDLLPKPVGQVCGPITSGGLGNVDKNLAELERTIAKLSVSKNVFSQMPLQKHIFRIDSLMPEYDAHALLEGIYLPIFREGLDEAYFMPSWMSSMGARWEHEHALRFGLKIVYLPEDF